MLRRQKYEGGIVMLSSDDTPPVDRPNLSKDYLAGIPVAFTELLPDPLGDLVARYARTHGPFTAAAVAQRYGLGVAVVTGMLHRLAADGRVTEGEFLPSLAGPQWCDSGVLRLLRRRCLARLRQEAEPVPPQVLAAFLPAWQNAVHGVPADPGRAAGPAGRRPGAVGRPAPTLSTPWSNSSPGQPFLPLRSSR